MPSTLIRQNVIARARKVVVKVGTNALTDDGGRLDERVVSDLAGEIAAVMKSGVSVTLVASGAIGAGIAELNLPARPREMSLLQATAAVGQGQLMRTFHDVFARFDVKVAQVLLLRDDFEHRRRYLNIRHTLTALAHLGVLPIINENDAVGGREICIGDNDVVAALLTNMLRADLLVLLTNVEGVMKDGAVVDVIERVDGEALSLAGPHRSKLGSGGMGSKMQAAGMVAAAGEAAVVASARTPGVLRRLMAGEKVGTVFVPSSRKLSSRRRWIGQAAGVAGRIVIDDGAAQALVEQGKSLLPSGIVGVMGHFDKGATVEVLNRAGRPIARGITAYSARQIDLIKGLKTSQIAKALGKSGPAPQRSGGACSEFPSAVIHRNNMTMS